MSIFKWDSIENAQKYFPFNYTQHNSPFYIIVNLVLFQHACFEFMYNGTCSTIKMLWSIIVGFCFARCPNDYAETSTGKWVNELRAKIAILAAKKQFICLQYELARSSHGSRKKGFNLSSSKVTMFRREINQIPAIFLHWKRACVQLGDTAGHIG